MRRLASIAVIIATMVGFSSCKESTLDEELDDYCTCVNDATDTDDLEKCRVLVEEMSEKYEYDPEAAAKIKKRLKECLTN